MRLECESALAELFLDRVFLHLGHEHPELVLVELDRNATLIAFLGHIPHRHYPVVLVVSAISLDGVQQKSMLF